MLSCGVAGGCCHWLPDHSLQIQPCCVPRYGTSDSVERIHGVRHFRERPLTRKTSRGSVPRPAHARVRAELVVQPRRHAQKHTQRDHTRSIPICPAPRCSVIRCHGFRPPQHMATHGFSAAQPLPTVSPVPATPAEKKASVVTQWCRWCNTVVLHPQRVHSVLQYSKSDRRERLRNVTRQCLIRDMRYSRGAGVS